MAATAPPAPGAIKPAAAVWGWTTLIGRVALATVTPPFSWRGEFVTQAWAMALRVAFPAAFMGFMFGYFAPGVQLLSILDVFGDYTRVGRIVHTANFREQSIWNTGLIVSAVVGAAITADLGARKARGELAALEVIGVDIVRRLVVPRVLAVTVVTLFASTVTVIAEYYGFFPAVWQFEGDKNVFSAVATAYHPIDAFMVPFRSLALGLMIGITAVYAGLNAPAGPRGVGRAVNQSVVIGSGLALGWDWFSNSIYITLFHAETLV